MGTDDQPARRRRRRRHDPRTPFLVWQILLFAVKAKREQLGIGVRLNAKIEKFAREKNCLKMVVLDQGGSARSWWTSLSETTGRPRP